MGRRLHRGRQRAPRAPSSSASPTAARTCGPGEVVARASFRLAPGRPGGGQGDPGRRCASAAARRSPRGSRPSARPSRTPRTSGPRAAPPGQLLEAAGCRGLRAGGARFSEKHANFVENTGEATTADVLELMAEGRRRVHERFGVVLEPEVQVLGEVELARTAGSCEAPLVAVGGRSSPWSPSPARLLVRGPRQDGRADGDGAAAGGDDRRAAKTRSASPPTARSLALAAAARRTGRCRGCRCEAPPKGGRLAGPGAGTGARPRRRPGRAAPLRRRAATTAKAGWTSNLHLGDRTALRRRLPGGEKWRAAAAVLADPSITALDYVDLHAPEPARRRRLRTRTAGRTLNASGAVEPFEAPRKVSTRVESRQTLKSC